MHLRRAIDTDVTPEVKASQRDTHRNTGRNKVKIGNLVHATIQNASFKGTFVVTLMASIS
jgi:hypothetical protein